MTTRNACCSDARSLSVIEHFTLRADEACDLYARAVKRSGSGRTVVDVAFRRCSILQKLVRP